VTRYVIKKSDGPFQGAVLIEFGTWSHVAQGWQLFDSATEATLSSFGFPYPVEVAVIGAAGAGSANSKMTEL
jgi:hypothetical protein